MRTTKTIRILIVDNDARTLYGLVRHLDEDGMDADYESTGEMAIRSLNATRYDICLYNTILPDMSGFDLLSITLSLSPTTKVIMMTSSLVNENIRLALEKGAYYFVTKPIAPDYLREVIFRAIQCQQDRGCGEKANREYPRTASQDSIDYTLSMVTKSEDGVTYVGAKCLVRARTVDISEGGIGVITRFPLRENQTLVFGDSLNNKSGIVRWCSLLDEGTYRAGIKFV